MSFHWYSINFIPSIGIQSTPITSQHALTLLSLFNFSSRTKNHTRSSTRCFGVFIDSCLNYLVCFTSTKSVVVWHLNGEVTPS